MISGTSAEGPLIPMTPDGTVAWRAHNLSEGTLYLPPSATRQHADQVLHPPTGQEIGRGNSGGKLYEAQASGGDDAPLAIKEFSEYILVGPYNEVSGWQLDYRGQRGSLPTLRADVMLTTGLARVNQDRQTWRFRGAEVLGAFILHLSPDQTPTQDMLYARWLVRRARPVANAKSRDYMQFREMALSNNILGDSFLYPRIVSPSAKPTMPGIKKRRQLYTRALTSVGAGTEIVRAIDTDDHADNAIIEKLPVMKGRWGRKVEEQGIVTKIDISAHEGLKF